jgi:hypothetical protein
MEKNNQVLADLKREHREEVCEVENKYKAGIAAFEHKNSQLQLMNADYEIAMERCRERE